MRLSSAALCVLLLSILLAGCTGNSHKESYSLDSTGHLSAVCPEVTPGVEILFKNDSFQKARLTLHTKQGGDVISYMSEPADPRAAVIYVPGAGETAAAHDERMVRYAKAGYVFLYLDPRGNGGETEGLPFGQYLIQSDYQKYKSGTWPQYYQTVCDIMSAQTFLTDRFRVPVYSTGSSNGGRYAAVAAAIDPDFAGYIGISTSDWGLYDSLAGQGISGDPLRFAVSLEPSSYITGISPRPVWIFHARQDQVIPFEQGKALFNHAKDPKFFIEFNGTHGINPDVDERIFLEWAQIYGTRG